MQDADRVTAALAAIAPGHRRVAAGEWGLRVDAGGWPLDVGLALDAARGLLRAQAEVCGPGRVDPHVLLHRSRLTPLVKLTETRAGAVWVEGWLPVVAVGEDELDRLLGLLVECAATVRQADSAARRALSR